MLFEKLYSRNTESIFMKECNKNVQHTKRRHISNQNAHDEADTSLLGQIDPIQLLLGSNEFQILLNHILDVKSKTSLILTRIDSLESKITNDEGYEMDNKIKDLFPMQTIDNLVGIEKVLDEEEDTAKQLFTKLSLVGGYNYKNYIRRCLSILFSNKLASLCSWTGQKGNFKVGNTKTLAILKGAIKTKYPSMTDKDYEVVVMEWLKFGKQRDKAKASL